MSDSLPIRYQEMNTSEAAAFFINPSNTKYLLPFLKRPCGLADAALFLKVSKSHMSYWLKKLLKLELIQCIRVEKRGKHRVPIYYATADVFTVALEFVPLSSDEAMLEAHTKDFLEAEKRSVIRSARRHAEGWHLRYSADRLEILPQSEVMEEARMVNEFGQARFSDQQAREIRREMMAMLERYAKEVTEDGKMYLFKFLFVEAHPDA
jgi:DNA-binding transcriptional ArsR family regulator